MAVGVARGTDQGSLAVEVRSGEHVARCRGAGAVDGYLHITFGGVLDTDGHGQRAAQLTVNLPGGGPGADRTVAAQGGNVLRQNGSASCRERVCQPGSCSVVVVEITKKK